MKYKLIQKGRGREREGERDGWSTVDVGGLKRGFPLTYYRTLKVKSLNIYTNTHSTQNTPVVCPIYP